jgi:HAMP domain-containing protein
VALAEQLRSLAGSTEAQTPVWSATTVVLVVAAIAAVLLAAHLLSRRRTSVRHRAR